MPDSHDRPRGVGPPPPNGGGPPVLGDFEFLERIGTGAVGGVFKARQRSMDRIVAVKVLKPRLANDAAYVERFAREARAAARLSHPNIVLAIDAGEDHGYYYFAMEYVEGHTVGLLLKAGPLEERAALQIARQVAAAIDYAWSQERIVHRDIKPGNIIITPDGTAKLADLGLVHEADVGDQDPLADGGKILGTPFYIAPEQIRPGSELDCRCDLYALGATLFHMVTGRPPYEGGETKAVLSRHLHAPVPDPRELRPEVSDDTARIIRRLMAKDPQDRYPDPAALVADIDAVLGRRRPAAPRPPTGPKVRRVAARRHRPAVGQFIVLSLVLLILATFVAVVVGLQSGDSRSPTGQREGDEGTKPSPAADAYEEVKAFVEAKPDDYVGAIDRLRQFEKNHAGTTYQELAAQRRGELETELQKKAKAEFEWLADRARQLVAESRYGEALAVFDGFPSGLASEAWTERLAQERRRVREAAREHFEQALARARAHLADDEFDQALAVYDAVAGSLPAAWQEELAEGRAEVARRRHMLAQRTEARRRAAFHRLMAELARLYRRRRYQQAADLVRSAVAEMPAPYQGALERELVEIERLEEFWDAAEKGAARRVGEPFVVRGIRGTLFAVNVGQVTVETDGGLFTGDIRDLPRENVVALALSALPEEERDLAAARFLTAEGQYEQAKQRLRQAEAAGADVEALRTRLGTLRHSALLARARGELDEARRAMEEGDAEEAAAALQRFIERYGDEPAAGELLDEARRLLDQARPKPRPLPAEARLACDGRYAFFLNGTLVLEGGPGGGEFQRAELSVRAGDVLAVEATAAGPGGGFYALLTVDGGRYVVPTSPAWSWRAGPAEGWKEKGEPEGTWRPAEPLWSPHLKPGYGETGRGLPGFWVWGEGRRCCLRKVLRLEHTVAEREAARRARQDRLTAAHGRPTKATLWLACRDTWRLSHNGVLVGCAASFLPRGASFPLLLRDGDVLGVAAAHSSAAGWLDAKLDVEGLPIPVTTDRTWAYAVEPTKGWNRRRRPEGRWRAPLLLGDGHRIWGEGGAAWFRKRVDLERLRSARARRLAFLHARVRPVAPRRLEVVYDFDGPEQLADWWGDDGWAWQGGVVEGRGGAFVTQAYRGDDVQFEAVVELSGDLVVGLWGERASPQAGYTATVTGPAGRVVLRREGRQLASERLADGGSRRRLLLHKRPSSVIVEVDGKRVVEVEDERPLPADRLWRVGVHAGDRKGARVGGVRIVARPDWRRMRARRAARDGAAADR
ncbi:MAG: protein kinase domain-containing protein [bacterium]